MDCKLRHERTLAREKLYEGIEEKAIDLDVTLPDYCADIQKILKCRLAPAITVRSAVSDRLELEGTAALSVYYLDASGEQVRCCEKSVPFSANLPLSRAVQAPVVCAETRVEYCNCRAVSSRRMDIHGAFSILAAVYDSGVMQTVSGIDEDQIEQKRSEITLSESAAMASHPFLVGNLLELGANRLPIDSILRSEANVFLEDCRVLSGTAVIKGCVRLELLYSPQSESAAPARVSFELPFSETVDCPGADPDCLCEARCELGDYVRLPKADSSGEQLLVSFEARVIASLFLWRSRSLSAVTDAYSRAFETKLGFQNNAIREICSVLSDSAAIRFSLNIGESEIRDLIDLWSEGLALSFEMENGTLSVKGKCTLCILWRSKEGKYGYLERPKEFSVSRSVRMAPEAADCEGIGSLKSLEGKLLPGGELELKAELFYSAAICARRNWQTVSAVFEDETLPIRAANADSLSICFASAGEELWKIAKDHRASVAQLRAENPAAGEILSEKTMLLIPM